MQYFAGDERLIWKATVILLGNRGVCPIAFAFRIGADLR